MPISDRPVIGVTMGDSAGIGPEIVLDAVSDQEVLARCRPVIIGHQQTLLRCAEATGKRLDLSAVGIDNVETAGIGSLQPGILSREAGLGAEAYVRRACQLALSNEIEAIATAPINKESLRLAGVEAIGHTEMLAAYLNSPDPLTLFITERMRIFFLSRHFSLRRALDLINEEQVYSFIKRVHEAMTANLGFDRPSIGLAALNPHASDGGQFGNEEAKHLIPAARRAREDGIDCSDPIGADSIFHMALEGRFDCVIALYHDQGHIAAKTRDFYGTVTATLGLPVLRTSVDHGSALDIAWKGVANPISMKRAICAAVDLLRVRNRIG
ncbi:MAG: 4-hydroxythreonine-4-phosphate dehydrogenase PdxA [Armatimonadota bacterium]